MSRLSNTMIGIFVLGTIFIWGAPELRAQSLEATTLETKYRDWTVRCRTVCESYQILKDIGGTPIAEFIVIKLPEGSSVDAGAIVVTSSGTSQAYGVVLTVGSHDIRYPITECADAKCITRLGIPSDLLADLKSSGTAEIVIAHESSPNAPLRLRMSLAGFTAAYRSLEQ